MKLLFIGADHEVTGSCHGIEACGKKILIDYGMQQGRETYLNADLPWPASQIDFVLLTHAHIDHSGLLPLLYSQGFRGKICATDATKDLCGIMLRDSAHIQEFEAEWKNRKATRSGKPEVTPLYTMEDAIGVIRKIEGFFYNKKVQIAKGIELRFIDAGHLLGSSSIEIWITEEHISKKLVFSGDIGNQRQPLIRNPEYIDTADYAIMESTYGNRNHEKPLDFSITLAKILQQTFDRGGNLVIPSFAVGRTQEILYYIRDIKKRKLIQRFPEFQVFVDSPLAVDATNIFQENRWECYDEEAMEFVKNGINPISFPGLNLSITSDESKAINFDTKPKVIISASGMCEAGRIRHHLKHNLWRPECTILFVGYQAFGTLGRSLLEGTKEVHLFGETIDVRASIENLPGLSGHADKDGLITWITHLNPKPHTVFVVHGEDTTINEFSAFLQTNYQLNAVAPFSGAIFDLASGEWILQPEGIPAPEKAISVAGKRALDVYERLVSAGQRLLMVITRNKGTANKDLARFSDQINNLSDKWDKPESK